MWKCFYCGNENADGVKRCKCSVTETCSREAEDRLKVPLIPPEIVPEIKEKIVKKVVPVKKDIKTKKKG